MKKLLAVLLSVTAMLGISASADTTEKNINVFTNYVNVEIDGEVRNVRNFLTEDGTTYIALRDVSELLDCTVDWEDTTKTAVISTTKPTEPIAHHDVKYEFVEETIAVLEDYVNITIDGAKKDIRNFLSDGTTYIALIDVSELLGCTVDWVHTTKTAVIKKLNLDEIAITVDGVTVSVAEFSRMYLSAHNYYDDEVTTEEKIELVKNELVTQTIADSKVKEFGIDTSDFEAEVLDRLSMLDSNYGVEVVDESLAENGYTRESYIKDAVKAQSFDALLAYMIETFPEYKEIEDGAEEYYNAHKSEFKEYSVQVKHILIPTTDDYGQELSPDEKSKAFDVATRIYNKATPENFDALVALNSTDYGMPYEGYRVVKNSEFVPEFEEAALKLKKNQISKPVETVYGYHIIMATDVSEYLPYDMFLQDYLITKFGEIDMMYINKWIDEAEVAYNDTAISAAVSLAENTID